MTTSGSVEVDPYKTTEIPEAGVSVYHDGNKKATVTFNTNGMVRLGETSGQWRVKVLPR